jgi:predicted TIM-barrel fold metal-dependent hydrolase
MSSTQERSSADVRAGVGHPIIDADGHMVELPPVLEEYVKQLGGGDMAKRYAEAAPVKRFARQQVASLSVEERRDFWATLTTWWMWPTKNGVDRATAHFPRLMHERMDELGLDLSIIYPSEGLTIVVIPDEELRRVSCRALNTMMAEMFSSYSDRIVPAAMIPAHTPDQAIEDLNYAVNELGFKVATFPGYIVRPVPRVARDRPEMAGLATRLDLLALDSDYDYDPLWTRCQELGIAPSFHCTSMGIGTHRSISNFVYNHVGGAAAGLDAICKALVLGGVTRRFPDLNFSFLEGGVAWACATYASLIGHWEKRNVEALQWIDPANLDAGLMDSLLEQYGEGGIARAADEVRGNFRMERPRPADLDDFALCEAKGAEEFADLFVRPFYFGCEADDPLNVQAFDTRVNPFGARLQAMLSSDISHWDVPHMNKVVGEAYELVERGLMSDDDFADFAFRNVVELYGQVNPSFFEGTVVEEAAAKALA